MQVNQLVQFMRPIILKFQAQTGSAEPFRSWLWTYQTPGPPGGRPGERRQRGRRPGFVAAMRHSTAFVLPTVSVWGGEPGNSILSRENSERLCVLFLFSVAGSATEVLYTSLHCIPKEITLQSLWQQHQVDMSPLLSCRLCCPALHRSRELTTARVYISSTCVVQHTNFASWLNVGLN